MEKKIVTIVIMSIYGVCLLHVVPTTTTMTSSEDMLFSLRERITVLRYEF